MSCIRSTALFFISIKFRRLMKLEHESYSFFIFQRAWKQTFHVLTDLLLLLNHATRKVEIPSSEEKLGSPHLEYHFMMWWVICLPRHVQKISVRFLFWPHVFCPILIWRGKKGILLKTEGDMCPLFNAIALALDPKYPVRSVRWVNNIPAHSSIQYNWRQAWIFVKSLLASWSGDPEPFSCTRFTDALVHMFPNQSGIWVWVGVFFFWSAAVGSDHSNACGLDPCYLAFICAVCSRAQSLTQ